MTVSYSVALCTHNNADRLKRTLEDFKKLHTPEASWEFLIIDNGCHDGTADFLARYVWPVNWQVRVVREEKLGLSNARNRAIVESEGEYVIFIDDDETVDPDWLCAYERLIVSKRPDAFGGRICVMFEDMRPPWLVDELLGFLGELNRMDTVAPLIDPGTSFNGGNFGIRKSICKSIGNFDAMLGRKGTDNTGGEEVDFYRRLLSAGMRVWWTPEAIIYHRILAEKLKRSYFLDLHYREGRMNAIRARGENSRFPPKYFFGQLFRALAAVWHVYRKNGRNATLRKEMNVAYFLGQITGWAFGS
jgi:glucosyl-dolichyl phosphate glucuronosyltransferase